MSAATPLPETTYPTPPELIGEPAAVAQPQPSGVDPYTREILADRHRAGDSIADLADDYGLDEALVEQAVGQVPEQAPAPRRRHRWEEVGAETWRVGRPEIIHLLSCRRCGLTARRVPTRTGGSLRMEVMPDEGSKWTPEISECPGAEESRSVVVVKLRPENVVDNGCDGEG